MDSSSIDQNTGSVLMGLAFNPMFGYMDFQIDPVGIQGQDTQNVFPVVPYVSLEAVFMVQMMSNPMSAPYTTYGGSNTGQQVVSGQVTMQDQNGVSRYQQGFQS